MFKNSDVNILSQSTRKKSNFSSHTREEQCKFAVKLCQNILIKVVVI